MVCCRKKLAISMGRIWLRFAKRLGVRKTGMMKLKYDVQACEYQDVHVLWELFEKSSKESVVKKKKPYQKMWEWAKRSPRFCSRF